MPITLPDLNRESLRHRVHALPPVPDFRHLLPDRRNTASRERLLARVRGEFREMPGLTLTLLQAQRLFGIRRDVCLRVLATLIQEGLLRRTAAGCYAALPAPI